MWIHWALQRIRRTGRDDRRDRREREILWLRRGSAGIAITGYSPRITSSGPPSRHSPSGMSAGRAMPRLAGMRSADIRQADMQPATAATHSPNRAPTTPSGKAWAKLMAQVGEEFPREYPGCGADIRLLAFTTDPGPIRKILTHLGEPLEPPPVSPTRGPPTDWEELVQVHDDRAIFQTTDRRAARDRRPQPLTAFHATVRTAREKSSFKAGLRYREKSGVKRG